MDLTTEAVQQKERYRKEMDDLVKSLNPKRVWEYMTDAEKELEMEKIEKEGVDVTFYDGVATGIIYQYPDDVEPDKSPYKLFIKITNEKDKYRVIDQPARITDIYQHPFAFAKYLGTSLGESYQKVMEVLHPNLINKHSVFLDEIASLGHTTVSEVISFLDAESSSGNTRYNELLLDLRKAYNDNVRRSKGLPTQIEIDLQQEREELISRLERLEKTYT